MDYFSLLRQPGASYHPFVRWWWNGNKVQPAELIRELRLLKEAWIGGVEINPIKFPENTDDLGIQSLTWLSDEWIDALKATLYEAKNLDLTCYLIVGSGWPFGGEFLEDEERGQIMAIGVSAPPTAGASPTCCRSALPQTRLAACRTRQTSRTC